MSDIEMVPGAVGCVERSPRRISTLRSMARRQQRFLGCMTLLAALCALAQAISGLSELALLLTPLFILLTLLLCGHYVAEERIVRRWSAAAPRCRRARRASVRWPSLHTRPLTSQLERRPGGERG